MAERPEPVRDLDWEPARARAFIDDVADIYEELLAKLASLPVIVDEGADDVRRGVAIDVPREPMPQEELIAYLRRMTFEHSRSRGIRGSPPTSRVRAPFRAPPPTCSPRAST
jgi:hypothetical protein